jgi:hypothetical protein
MIRKLLVCAILLPLTGGLYAQSVAINDNGQAPNASAALDITSSAKGLLIPRLTTVERNQITNPATALLIYNKDSLRFQVNLGTPEQPKWNSIVTFDQLPASNGNGGSGWSLSGNSGTTDNTYLGTKDNKPLQVKTNDVLRLFVDGTSNKIGIGTNAPKASLDINTTDAIKVPVGTTAERPSTPTVGMLRYNNTTNKLEGYTTNGWVSLN